MHAGMHTITWTLHGQKCKVHQCNSEVYCFGICESDFSTVVFLEWNVHIKLVDSDNSILYYKRFLVSPR